MFNVNICYSGDPCSPSGRYVTKYGWHHVLVDNISGVIFGTVYSLGSFGALQADLIVCRGEWGGCRPRGQKRYMEIGLITF